LLVFNYSILISNITFAQDWTACYNGIFNGACGVNCLEKLNNYIFASVGDYGMTENSKIYRSSDNGVNWYPMNTPGIYVINSLFVSGTDIFAGTLSYGLFYSSDYGLNWMPRGFNTGGYSTVYGIEKSGPNLLIYVSSLSTSLCYSTDNGLNWNPVTTWSLYRRINSFLNYNNSIFAGCFDGVYKSSDNGMTWSERGLQSSSINKLYYFQGSIYAGANDSIYRTTNEGLNWYSCVSGINNYTGAYSISSIGNLLFAGTFRGVYCSSNGGDYWYSVNSGLGGTPKIDALLSSNTKLYAGANFGKYGVFATNDNGQNWFKSGFNLFHITSLILNGNTLFVGTDSSGIYYSTNEGSIWYPAKNELNNNYITSLIKHGSNIFAGTVDSGVYKSSNNGQNWNRVNSGLGSYFIKSFLSEDTSLFAGTVSGIYKTTNNGTNWIYYGLSAIPINAMIINNNNFLAGTDNGIQITTNNGINWTSGILTGKSVKGFYIFNNRIYSGTNNGVYSSSNNGLNWYQNGLDTCSINSFTNFSDTLACSSSNGIYVTTNGGTNWIWLGPRYEGETKPILAYNGNIYTGGIKGYIGGDILTGCIWKRVASTLSGIRNISNEVVSNYCLFQNYPNPFNPVTKIKFDIKKEYRSQESEVKLSIYDILGRKIEDLVNEKLQPGTYEVTFDGSNLPSGVYFYQLRVGTYLETKKMLLIK